MPRKEKKYHFMYKTINLVTGKYYLGMHSTNNLNDGYHGSGRRLRYSLEKYGKENHSVEILEFFDTRDELKENERNIVNLNEISKEKCMNMAVGGEGGFISLDGVKMGRKKTDDILRKKYGDDFRKIVSENYWASMTPEELCIVGNKIREGQKRVGIDHGKLFLNKKHSKESKRKMSESKKGKGIGEDNSQYGTCWIYHLMMKENKKVKKEDLYNWIDNGWVKGRNMKF